MEAIALKRCTQQEVAAQIEAIDALFKASLERSALADENSDDFIEPLHASHGGDLHRPLGLHGAGFDDRRTALPGATFRGRAPLPSRGTNARAC
jgi:hypothetical protein